jgi:hypothetical protein
LVVVLTTDLSVPVDFDWLTWEITKSGASEPWRLGSSAVEAHDFPGTIAINTGEGLRGATHIRVQALRGGASGQLVVEREAEAILPTSGVKELWMPLNWLCSSGNRTEACSGGDTCRAGECERLDMAPVAEFPDYTSPDGGACFNVQDCFGTAGLSFTNLPDVWHPETGTCELTGSEVRGAEQVNVALIVNAGHVGAYGACRERQGCRIVLDRDTPEGWSTLYDDEGKPRGIGLPNAVCEAVQSKTIEGIIVIDATPECPLKTRDRPVCPEEPLCLKTDGPCPEEWPANWIGFACSGGQVPRDVEPDLLSCWPAADLSDAEGPTSGRQCCVLHEEPTSTDSLLIDDMSGGSQIKFRHESGEAAGFWFVASDDPSAVTPRPNRLVTYRAVDPPITTEDGTQIHHAACLESEGIEGFHATVGFAFFAEFQPFDVSRFRGLSFWGWARDVGTTIKVEVTNVDTSGDYPEATCLKDGNQACYDSHAIQALVLSTVWGYHRFEWTELEQSAQHYGTQFDEFNPNVLDIAFTYPGPGTGRSQPFEFCISQIRFLP